jgi:hypothetical protein
MKRRCRPLVRDEGVAGSNPATPTKQHQRLSGHLALRRLVAATNSATEKDRLPWSASSCIFIRSAKPP